MDPTHEKSSGGSRVLVVLAAVVLLLVVAMFLRRREFPDGSFIRQQRTTVEEEVNANLGDVLAATVPGSTTTAELVAKVGGPTAKVERDGLELWVYTWRRTTVVDRRLFGLIPTGSSTNAVESQMPVGVKDGVVVHTYVSPSPDPAVKAAVESLWDAYTTGH